MKHVVLILLGSILYLSAAAQMPRDAVWSAAELRTSCITVSEAGLRARAADCAVREFGKVAELDGSETWYPLYSNFPALQGETASIPGDFGNVLVLFGATSGSDRLAPFHIFNAEGSYWNSFKAPQLFTTPFGRMLYIQGSGMGDGRG